jgi:hypothetical protein
MTDTQDPAEIPCHAVPTAPSPGVTDGALMKRCAANCAIFMQNRAMAGDLWNLVDEKRKEM